ncbi:BRCT-containing protein 1 [Tolypocladium ophioglossoides CBS 100239]|uniref:BRCT-containing protein 1 n=1 Tax=Tolypocladium ophioglossoides (strain CBS 100239) TaxID=1163406 RepID=A0A0L0NA71_TOLOC|nr:BRCT-containing protein 1 [Tolypocladium ophioglossoides CBS 100239]
MGDAGDGIFGECSVAFVSSNSLTPRVISELSSILEDNGASIREPRRDGSIPIEKVSHIISNTIDFPQYVESQAVMIPVVTTQWITASVSRRRQAQVRPFSPDPRMIFAEVVVTCADLPEMDKESIIGATMALGGQESKDSNRFTTHICALSMDNAKVANAMAKNFKGKVVLPHWFDACFKLGKRIDEGPYLLPDPEILKMTPGDELQIPVNANLDGATSVCPTYLPFPPDADVARPPATVFQDRNVLLSWDLGITPRLTKVLSDIIGNGGGKVVADVANCDMFICQYRDGPQYIQASQSCKEVGSLSWLFSLIVHNQWRNPLHRLLHYPVPKNGIEGFRDLRITVSNYGGEARIYLENLIKACGAEFTKTMKADNTHLITARDTSEKCRAAPEWGVAVVNHLWIEESYAKDIYYPGGEESMSPRAKRKRKILEAAEDNAYHKGPAEGVVIGRSEQDRDFDVMRDEGENDGALAKKANASTAMETPVRSRHVHFGKENDTPSVVSTGGRSAKAKARDMLQNIALDIALYEREKKRHSKAGAPWGGKRAADLAEKEENAKAGAKPVHGDDGEAKRPAKKARPSLPEVDIRIVVTGYKRWVGDRNKEDQDRRKLRDLGVQIVQEFQPCDYVAAPNVMRTVKLLCALARGATVLSTDFIEQALQTGEVPDPDDFFLQDEAAEKLYDLKLERSASRAKANRGKLLQGIPIYCTEKIRNGTESFRAIAEANGAIFKLYRARSGTTIKPTTAEEDGGAPPEPVYLLSNNSSEDKKLWPRFEEMAKNGNMEPRIVAPDWLLDVAMAQQVRFDKKFLVENFHRRES